MTTSESVTNIMDAIHKVQQNADPVKKNADGQVGQGKFRYANLVSTWGTVKDLLKSNGLTIVQSPTMGDHNVGQQFQTTIYHSSGEWVKETMQMALQREDPQALGAAISYYRRYMVTSMLGLIPDDDNDAKDHRLATAQQKAQWIGAVRLIYPDISKPQDIIQTIESIVGKHPSRIREDEAENTLNLIKAFTSKAVQDEQGA